MISYSLNYLSINPMVGNLNPFSKCDKSHCEKQHSFRTFWLIRLCWKLTSDTRRFLCRELLQDKYQGTHDVLNLPAALTEIPLLLLVLTQSIRFKHFYRNPYMCMDLLWMLSIPVPFSLKNYYIYESIKAKRYTLHSVNSVDTYQYVRRQSDEDQDCLHTSRGRVLEAVDNTC